MATAIHQVALMKQAHRLLNQSHSIGGKILGFYMPASRDFVDRLIMGHLQMYDIILFSSSAKTIKIL